VTTERTVQTYARIEIFRVGLSREALGAHMTRTHQHWDGWGIFDRSTSLAIFDARFPVYWKRDIAKRVAEEYRLTDAVIRKVRLCVVVPAAHRGRKPYKR